MPFASTTLISTTLYSSVREESICSSMAFPMLLAALISFLIWRVRFSRFSSEASMISCRTSAMFSSRSCTALFSESFVWMIHRHEVVTKKAIITRIKSQC